MTTYRELACHLRHQFRSDLHACPIIGVDGFSGSGKSDFAQSLALELDAPVINTDDWVPGWDGLRTSIELLEEWVLVPLSQGRPASWQRYDWELMRAVEWHDVAPAPIVIVEGCGVGHKTLSSHLSYLVWVNAPEELRLERIRGRFDWKKCEPFVDRWAEQERALRTDDDVAQRADLVVESDAILEGVDLKEAFVQRLNRE